MYHRYWCSHHGKHYGSSFKKLKIELPGVMSSARLSKTSFVHIPLPITIWPLFTDKGPFWELWDPAPYTKGPRRSLVQPCIR